MQASALKLPLFLSLSAGLVLTLTACDGCEREAPYTPFTVSSGSAEAPPEDAEAPAAEAAPSASVKAPAAFAPRTSVKAPSQATEWKLGGRSLVAPAGQVFELALEADFDADQKTDIVTWSVATDPTQGKQGALWLHPAEGKPRELQALPSFIPTGPSCKISAQLDQTGPQTITWITRASCSTQLLPRAPVGAVMVLAPNAKAPKLLELRLADVAKGERRQIQVDSSDRDGDKLDDIRIKFRLERGEASATVDLGWFQRAQGVARDDAEPIASLNAGASALLSQAKQKGDAALSGILAARRLWSNLCAESHTPRVLDGEGQPMACRAGAFLSKLNEAEVQAALKSKHPVAAFAALEREGWFGTFDAKTQTNLRNQTLKLFDTKTVKSAQVSARAQSRGPEPRFSPLRFEESGDLLVQIGRTVQRVNAEGESQDVSEEVDPWPLTLSNSSGQITQVLTPCDSPLVQLSGKQTISANLLSPRPGACSPNPTVPALRVVPLSFSDQHFEGFIAGSPVAQIKSRAEAIMRPGVFGSARSPSGKYEILPFSSGIVIIGPERPQLWSSPSLDVNQLGDCVIDNTGKLAACVDEVGMVLKLSVD